MTRINQYLEYHKTSAAVGDIDPGHAMLLYICKRYELSVEQRYWLAWLYGMTYHGPSAFYIYNEFPDFENVDVDRLQRWWDSRGRDEMMTQSDRRWVRSSSQFVDAFVSYRNWVDFRPQADHFRDLTQCSTPEMRYEGLYQSATQLYSFGQFALFLYLEALHTITPLDLCPTDLNLEQAWSCRYGLYYAYGLDNLVHDKQAPMEEHDFTAAMWDELKATVAKLDTPPTIWQTETILCAFRKYHRGKRYIGFYLDRQAADIAKMQDRVDVGVYWDVLWHYRKETYHPEWLAETGGHVSEKGVTREWKDYQWSRTAAYLEAAKEEDDLL